MFVLSLVPWMVPRKARLSLLEVIVKTALESPWTHPGHHADLPVFIFIFYFIFFYPFGLFWEGVKKALQMGRRHSAFSWVRWCFALDL